MQDNDILFYVDIGCEFQIAGRKRLLEIIEEVRHNEIMGWTMEEHLEKTWTKADIFAHFGALGDTRYTDTGQVAANIIMLRKTQRTQRIMQEWLDIFLNHFELVDDSPSKIANDSSFIENRHDQSIWSMLNKKYNIKNFRDFTLCQSGIEPHKYPIVTTRNKIFLEEESAKKLNGYIHDIYELKRYKAYLSPLVKILSLCGKLYPKSQTRKTARRVANTIINIVEDAKS